MPSSLKFVCPLHLDMEIRQRAHRTGRTISDVILLAIQKGLGPSPAETPDAVIDVVERGASGSKNVAAYLSPPLAKGIQKLAAEHRRSASWVMRSLIRESLRARGLLSTPSDSSVDASAALAELRNEVNCLHREALDFIRKFARVYNAHRSEIEQDAKAAEAEGRSPEQTMKGCLHNGLMHTANRLMDLAQIVDGRGRGDEADDLAA
jgi:Ribbon-helix-helix protein, copG family